MIKIDNTPIDVNEYLKKYPVHSIERETVRIMSASSSSYNYADIGQLDFELLLRREIVNSAKALNQSGLHFKVFRQSICNEKYWNRKRDGGFELKDDVSAAEAINDIYTNGSKYGTECATAMLIVYYKALLNVFSKERFDSMFKNIYLMNWSRIGWKLKEVGSVHKVADFLPGDRLYFDNPEVSPLTPYLQGENVIDLSGGKYYGHGVGIHSADAFIKMLNSNRKEGATKSAYLMDVAGRPNFKSLAKDYSSSTL